MYTRPVQRESKTYLNKKLYQTKTVENKEDLSFSKILKTVEKEEQKYLKKTVIKLLEDLNQSVDDLIRFLNFQTLNNYKESLKAIISRFIQINYKIKSFSELRIDYKVLKVLNQKTDKLLLNILEKEYSRILLLNQINEIKGLIVNILK